MRSTGVEAAERASGRPAVEAFRMAYDEKVAGRVRRVLADFPGVAEKKMFGGLAFLPGGHMCCGVIGRQLMVRVGPADYEAALSRPHARPMDFTGRPLTGFVYVEPGGISTAAALRAWLSRGVQFAASLPPGRRRRRATRTR